MQLYIKLGTNTTKTSQQKIEDVISFNGTVKEEYLVRGKRWKILRIFLSIEMLQMVLLLTNYSVEGAGGMTGSII